MSHRAPFATARILAVIAVALVALSADAAIPSAEKIANAVAAMNRVSGRAVPVLVDITLTLGDSAVAITGVLASHPTGLARLELRTEGFIERHLLLGNVHTASRDGQLLSAPYPFLPPVFFLQATSGAALRAALASFGVPDVEVVLGRVGDRDCYVFGGRLPRAEDGEEQMLPSLWVDMESFEVVLIDRPDGIRFRFGPSADFGGIRLPSWIDVESPDLPTARLQIDRAAPANAPAAAFGSHWLLVR
ncbi:MAG: hypothetical protein VCE43_05905 [Myxococcota bacterium]